MRSLLILYLFLPGICAAQLTPIGQWSEHLSYHHSLSISGADSVFFVSTPNAVFSVSGSDNVITRYNTITGLHASGISSIQLDPSSGNLIIGYLNSDIDVLSTNTVTEIPDLELSPITGDKTIHSIYILGQNAYLSTGLGIVAVDLTQFNILDTYVIGSGGAQVPVYSVTSDSLYMYAATAQGLLKAQINGPNLADYRNWTLPVVGSAINMLPCSQVIAGNGYVYLLRNDSIFRSSGGAYQPLFSDGYQIRSIQFSSGQLVVCEQNQATVVGIIKWLDTLGNISKVIQQPGTLLDPRGIWENSGDTWIADAQRGLIEYNGSTFISMVPNSPDGPLNGQMLSVGNQLWIAGGGLEAGGSYAADTSGFYRYASGQWTGYNVITQPSLQGIQDVVTLAVQTKSDTVYAGSSTGGLVQLSPAGNIQTYASNSFISPSTSGSGNYQVTGLTYDSTGNLWIVNSGALQPLIEKGSGGAIQKFNLPVVIPNNQLGKILTDDYHYLWIAAAPGYGALCFNPATNQWKSYQTGVGTGNLPDPNVNCMVMDKQGLVWMGTNNGIAVIECGANVFTTGCDATLPVVQNDAFAGYLFQGQPVYSIAVDGADRKWVGTNTGAWLISEDGEKVISNFTAENSPLFNDTVTLIGINGVTGDVFFSTPTGLCSYRGTATEASENPPSVLVFPNPVPPGYAGTIAIKGVPDGAIVKITELSGRLVYETKALGGQAVWNGQDYTGRRIASGVYIVLIADQNNQEKSAAKIVFIH
jgi:hypothetical protein